MVNKTTGFHNSTESLLRSLGVDTLPHVMGMVPEHFTGVRHALFDADGVIAPYGQKPSAEVVNRLQELNEELPDGISVVTNNRNPPRLDGIPVFARTGIRIKQLPGKIPRILETLGVDPAETIGIGDGLTDLLVYKWYLGRTALVKSIGAHPVQEIVHDNIYVPFLNVLSRFSRE